MMLTVLTASMVYIRVQALPDEGDLVRLVKTVHILRILENVVLLFKHYDSISNVWA